MSSLLSTVFASIAHFCLALHMQAQRLQAKIQSRWMLVGVGSLVRGLGATLCDRAQCMYAGEAVENYPLVVAPVGSIQPCRVLLRSGSGRRVVSRGILDRDSLDSSKVS